MCLAQLPVMQANDNYYMDSIVIVYYGYGKSHNTKKNIASCWQYSQIVYGIYIYIYIYICMYSVLRRYT